MPFANRTPNSVTACARIDHELRVAFALAVRWRVGLTCFDRREPAHGVGAVLGREAREDGDDCLSGLGARRHRPPTPGWRSDCPRREAVTVMQATLLA